MKKLILTMCLTAAGVFGAAAQMRLTLSEALDLALSENPTVKVAEMEVQRFDYVKRQTWGSWIPQISVGGTYTRSIVKQSMTKGLSFGADNTLAAQGDATWTLFAPAVFRTLKMTAVQRAAAVESARSSRITQVAEGKQALGVLAAGVADERKADAAGQAEQNLRRGQRHAVGHGLARDAAQLCAGQRRKHGGAVFIPNRARHTTKT